ncbi:MAG: hydroxyethylthiazole kinase [Eubacteriales bacterium]|nr:hydroxyethylthiazole kinase [Eubacteriales bacterium]MDY3332389.1 hydroxyethylthiazole kinase [Gallibacter sp.]
MLGKTFDNLREKTPLVHNITNYVTVNDVANMVLACGASPIMADDLEEVEEITAICDGLCINIGTLNKRTIDAMIVAGKKSKELGHIVLLDPVGAGASRLRTSTAIRILDEVKPDIIRGNISEIKTLAIGSGNTKGVDADVADSVTEDNLDEMIAFAKEFATRIGAIVAITGAIDLVSDGRQCCIIKNGTKEMGKVTGTGCQLSALTTAFAIANRDDKFHSTVAAVCSMGLAGEIALSLQQDTDGNSTYRNRIIDAIYNMNGNILDKGAKYEFR